MHLKILLIEDSDFPELIGAMWEAFENPYQSFFRTLCPIHNDDRATSLAEDVERQREFHIAEQPTSYWLKIVDTDANDKIVGGAKWNIYDENPYAGDSSDDIVADWYPEGTVAREFATRFVNQLESGRQQRARRPHVFLNIAFTIPAYRRRGISDIFMKWGIEKADALGMETWLDSTDLGRRSYERYGFVVVVDRILDPPMPDNLSKEEQAEWERMRETIPPTHNCTMWRPKGGKYIEGETVKTWELDANKVEADS